MWKESYRIGIDLIDKQHIELFRMVYDLVKAIESNAGKNIYIKSIDFLKDYVVRHFTAEEAYQESIKYSKIAEHKEIHRTFTNSVLKFEKRLEQCDYDIGVVKELTGMLSAWLIYHVADADQKIARESLISVKLEQDFCIKSLTSSLIDTLEKLTALSPNNMSMKTLANSQAHGDILVDVGLTGDLTGHAYFSFTNKLALKLMEIMMLFEPREIDELVCSALAEISNITSGNAANILAGSGKICNIDTPIVSINGTQTGNFESVEIDTGVGFMTISMLID